jgi:hypothetical protein
MIPELSMVFARPGTGHPIQESSYKSRRKQHDTGKLATVNSGHGSERQETIQN